MIIASILVAIIIGLSGSYFLYKGQIGPISETSEIYMFEVVEGDTLSSIAVRLEDAEVIKSATFTEISAKINGVEGFIVGLYKLDKSWDSLDVLTYLCNQENVESTSVMLTFREGMWAKDIAAQLDPYFDYTTQEIIDFWNDNTFLTTVIAKYDFLDESILDERYEVKLEGYLFPETYMFDYDMTLEEITYVFLDQFEVVYEELASQVEESQFSIHEWVNLASIVQYESASTTDMQNISKVFLNRLDIDMKLQSSVTVCYALYEFDSWEQCESEYDYVSPYNTYLYNGLPIGPILNPGFEALNAVLNPIDNDYLFFLADVYGDGAVYYSYTFEEHLEKQKQYLGY